MDVGTIVTEGAGRVEQPGDRAELDLRFEGAGTDRASAVAALGARMAAAAGALEHPALKVRHRRLWVGTRWREDVVVGAQAVEHLDVVVTDVAALEEILAALVAAEPAGLGGPRWTLADEAAARREAQKRAVADARDRAEGYADALGGTLGALISLGDAGAHQPAPRMMAMAAREAAVPDVRDLGLEPEPVEVTARCTATWELLT
ncbi:MAG: SIMPL domain-containing protein [Pseudonocardia sp.]